MKARTVFLFILLIIVADQSVKIWVKTHMPLSHSWTSAHPVSAYDNGIKVLGDKFMIYFVENSGAAWGVELMGGRTGKMVLTLFRLAAVIFGIFYIRSIIQKKYHKGFIVCAALIFAGALGNLIDSMFYGLIFEATTVDHVAKMFPAHGYETFLHGRVVDMVYLPIIKTHYPSWFPVWHGQEFEFFAPVFNIADASISIGVIAILLFQKRFFHKQPAEVHATIETNAPVNDTAQVL